MFNKLTHAFAASVVLAVAAVSSGAAAQSGMTYSDSYSFLQAVKERDGAKVQQLIGSSTGSIVINSRDRSNGEGALHYMVRERDISWLAFLLTNGARPDLQSSRGDTALTLAAQIGWLQGAEQLLARRASVDLANGRGETALIIATQRRDLAMVRLLLNRRADPRKADRVAGKSALDYARQDPRAAVVLKMLEAKVAPPKPAQGPKL
ncbi:MAG TPA: ankyrin repeat domain-containing protein [Allosphingosinicella sp.]|nr:ankyrin repeat domain-containing protein [Allosphingosinicella sp.]